MTVRWRRLLALLRELVADYGQLHERQQLLDRPWEEDFVHWSWDGQEWHLHGHLTPPPDGRRRSTTRDGWCPHHTRGPARPPPPP